ncbi:RNA-binding domain-containing protein [Jackrogersella minutella]|nr:RNA-binding domain-containing protein [Jackrogersella minutella]
MQSVRRAAARAVCSSIAVAVPRQQVASFAMQIGKANARPATMLPLIRYFSQTSRVAQNERISEEEELEEEEAFAAADEQNGFSAGIEAENIASAPAAESADDGFTVFISNITFDATDVHIREAFSKYGEVVALKVARDGRGLSRGFAFVTYKDKQSTDRAVQEANKSFWHGRRIFVDYKKAEGKEGGVMRPRIPMKPTTSLYIGNIPYETSDADLNKIFKDLDGVTDVRVAVDRNTGWPRGFAHADFADLESAQYAYEKLQAVRLGGRELRIDYAVKKPM